MKSSFLSTAALLLSLSKLTLSQRVMTVAYDEVYDNANMDLLTTACSDGSNGLVTKGFSVAGDLPIFPRVGAAFSVGGWNSPSCGKCYKLTFEETGVEIPVIAIDHAGSGFNLAKEAMDELTGGRAAELGRVDMSVTEAAPGDCGM
ncbi:allergenic cerato-platanin Asp F13 [Blastomyces gilchristii SLH14081]|uniref:Allergenic cerato-platanin Asp F13 n=1 Tax=Blastomyces gilchristii (strain SLH14081) TaxID=559298 RepID=A0A179UFD0_BLAGS|nr:allergenic cerato-platanin Asp F13 [Blastomyces gilchristii SLH14081]OAT05857.1 allergenic cerato-platanin Asp F13 [Blastomyces gilchristii SLH14081]